MQVRWMIPLGAAATAAASIAHVAVAAQYMTAEQAQKSAFPAATQFVPLAEPDAATAAALAETTAEMVATQVFDARNARRTRRWAT